MHRKDWDIVDKMHILSKTNNRCAHCGTPLSISSMTIDHFIPVSRGGNNDLDNIIPLCFECNQNKDSMVVQPSAYFDFLSPQYLELAEEMYSNFMTDTDNRHYRSLLSVDLFKFKDSSIDSYLERITAIHNNTIRALAKTKGFSKDKVSLLCKQHELRIEGFRKHTVKRAEYSDLDEIWKYYIQCGKNTGSYFRGDKAKIKEILTQLHLHGCIYFIRNKEGEIICCIGMEIIKINGAYFVSLTDILVKYARHVEPVFEVAITELLVRFREALHSQSKLPFVMSSNIKASNKGVSAIARFCAKRLISFSTEDSICFCGTLGKEGLVDFTETNFNFGNSNIQKKLSSMYNCRKLKKEWTISEDEMCIVGGDSFEDQFRRYSHGKRVIFKERR